MSTEVVNRSLTRPSDSLGAYEIETRADKVSLAVAATGVMLLMAFFGLTVVIAGWVSDLRGSEIGNVSLLGRVKAYEAWLLPVAVASIALVKFGIAVVLYGIVRRLWLRIESVKQSLPELIAQASGR